MIDPKFPSREQLRHMSLPELRSLRVLYPEEEELLQEAVAHILAQDRRPPKVYINDNDIKGAHIATREKEAELQAELDRRRAEALKQMNLSESELQDELVKINGEIKQEVISEPVKSDVKCELCGSRGFRHKKGCPTLTKLETANAA